jgi:hypothetical protein
MSGTDVFIFQSVQEFASACRHVVGTSPLKHSGDNWTSGESYGQSLKLAETGDLSLVPRAKAKILKVSSQLEVEYPTWTASPHGSYPVVPEAIIGLPTPMRQLTRQLSDVSGIKLYFSTSPSGSLSSAQIFEVGMEMLSLAMGLERIRPIELWWWEECGAQWNSDQTSKRGNNFLVAIKISTQPLDIARAAYMLTSAGFVRNLLFSFEHRLRYRWSSFACWNNESYSGAEHMEYARQMFRLKKHDTILPVLSAHHPLIKQPQEWLQSVINRYTHRIEEIA